MIDMVLGKLVPVTPPAHSRRLPCRRQVESKIGLMIQSSMPQHPTHRTWPSMDGLLWDNSLNFSINFRQWTPPEPKSFSKVLSLIVVHYGGCHTLYIVCAHHFMCIMVAVTACTSVHCVYWLLSVHHGYRCSLYTGYWYCLYQCTVCVLVTVCTPWIPVQSVHWLLALPVPVYSVCTVLFTVCTPWIPVQSVHWLLALPVPVYSVCTGYCLYTMDTGAVCTLVTDTACTSVQCVYWIPYCLYIMDTGTTVRLQSVHWLL
jgi:hypothetical protein